MDDGGEEGWRETPSVEEEGRSERGAAVRCSIEEGVVRVKRNWPVPSVTSRYGCWRGGGEVGGEGQLHLVRLHRPRVDTRLRRSPR